jgi:tRNA(adenine34) deaminase
MPLYNDEYFMQLALKEAEQAAKNNEIPVGAVIIDNGSQRVLGKGYNQTQQLVDVTAHAEILAITAASNALGAKYLTDCTLYVTLEPCPMCASALNWSKIGRIVIGAADVHKGFSRYSPPLLHPKTQVTEGLLSEACSHLINSFFAKKRN